MTSFAPHLGRSTEPPESLNNALAILALLALGVLAPLGDGSDPRASSSGSPAAKGAMVLSEQAAPSGSGSSADRKPRKARHRELPATQAV